MKLKAFPPAEPIERALAACYKLIVLSDTRLDETIATSKLIAVFVSFMGT